MSTRPISQDLKKHGVFQRVIVPKKWTIAVLLFQASLDAFGLAQASSPFQTLLGYIALGTSICVLPPPYPTTRPRASVVTSPLPKKLQRGQFLTSPVDFMVDGASSATITNARSPLISTYWDTDLTLASGVLIGFLAVVLLLSSPVESRRVDKATVIGGALMVLASALTLLYAAPRFLRSPSRGGVLFGLGFTIFSSQIAFQYNTAKFLAQGLVVVLSWLATRSDAGSSRARSSSMAYPGSTHMRSSSHPHEPYSKFTGVLLQIFQDWPLLHSILVEKDSRRIFYFMS
jgi:zinc transporter 5/7